MSFLNITFVDILDILMVAAIIYLLLRWIRRSSAMSIFIAILFLYVVRVVVSMLDMKMMTALMDTFLNVGVIALIVIFQPEIRHFLMRLGGNSGIMSKGRGLISKLLGSNDEKIDTAAVREIASACRSMAEQKVGALIVIQRTSSLDYIIESGDVIDAAISQRLIENIFFKNSPLHDGAVIIRNNRIEAARCTLPITERTDIPAHFGMRHKAAIGISEESDADVIVVSEQTGDISFVRKGEVEKVSRINRLKLLLGAAVSSEEEKEV